MLARTARSPFATSRCSAARSPFATLPGATSRRSARVIAMATPVIHYFPLRGRAEVMRLALKLVGVEYQEVMVDRAQMKSDLSAYPFGQCPRFVDGDIDITQSNTILRYIGRKYGLVGSTEKEQCVTDMVMEGVESVRQAYTGLIYADQLSDEAKVKYQAMHLDKASMGERNKGAHFGFLANFVAKSASGYVAGTPSPTIGDLCLWEILDLHMRIPEFKAKIEQQYPELVAFYTKIAELPNIKAYLPNRLEKINGNSLG